MQTHKFRLQLQTFLPRLADSWYRSVALHRSLPALDGEQSDASALQIHEHKITILPIRSGADDFTRTVYLSWLKDRPLSPAIRHMRDYIAEQYAFVETE